VLSVVNADGSTPNGSLIDEIVREGARRMLAAPWKPKSTPA
jgi:putative transposase